MAAFIFLFNEIIWDAKREDLVLFYGHILTGLGAPALIKTVLYLTLLFCSSFILQPLSAYVPYLCGFVVVFLVY